MLQLLMIIISNKVCGRGAGRFVCHGFLPTRMTIDLCSSCPCRPRHHLKQPWLSVATITHHHHHQQQQQRRRQARGHRHQNALVGPFVRTPVIGTYRPWDVKSVLLIPIVSYTANLFQQSCSYFACYFICPNECQQHIHTDRSSPSRTAGRYMCRNGGGKPDKTFGGTPLTCYWCVWSCAHDATRELYCSTLNARTVDFPVSPLQQPSGLFACAAALQVLRWSLQSV